MQADNELKKAQEEITSLKRLLKKSNAERLTAQSLAGKAILNHVRQVAINNMLWDVVDFALYNKPFVIEIPEKETEDERYMRVLKENVLKSSLARIDPM